MRPSRPSYMRPMPRSVKRIEIAIRPASGGFYAYDNTHNGIPQWKKSRGAHDSLSIDRLVPRRPAANHTMFSQVMGPGGGAPDLGLAAAIKRDFGSLDSPNQKFNDAGVHVFGSGWAFVTITGDGKLAIETRPGQDTPLWRSRAIRQRSRWAPLKDRCIRPARRTDARQ
jgi:hypothetical protein